MATYHAPLASKWAAVAPVAERHLGLFTAGHATRAGLTPHDLRAAVARGTIRRVRRGLYVVAGMPETWERRAMAVTLPYHRGRVRPAVVLSHWAAAYVHGFLGIAAPGRIDVLARPGIAVPGRDVRQHRASAFRDGDIAWVGPHPLTSVEWTVTDLAGVLGPMGLQRVFLDLYRRGRATPDRVLARLERRGRIRGARRLRVLLAEIDPTLRRIRSVEEGEARLVLTRAGLPAPAVANRVLARGRWFELDLCYPELKIAIEVDGRLSHTVGHDRRADAERQRALEAEGWAFVRVSTWELTRDPERFLADVQRARALRGAA